MDTYLLKISQGHTSLANIELDILFGGSYEKLDYSLAYVQTTYEKLEWALKRTAAIRFAMKELSRSVFSSLNDLSQLVNQADLGSLPTDFTYRVDAFKVGEDNIGLPTPIIAKEIGRLIALRRTDAKVDLHEPSVRFTVCIWDFNLSFGIFIKEIKGKDYDWKAPKMLPHFRGGALKPVVARFMTTILNPDDGEWVLDPFCGHGGILLELYDIGANPVGVELSPMIVRQAQKNLKHIHYNDTVHIIMGDAFHMPFRKKSFLKMVTDPPYAIQTTTSGRKPGDLFFQWLNTIWHPAKIVFAMPKTIMLKLPNSWKLIYEAEDYVHRNLTRIFRVITHE